MKRTEINRLIRQHLLPHLPNWGAGRGMLFVKPVAQCLCSVAFGTSSFDANLVYSEAIVQPLYLPPMRDRFQKIKQINRPGGLRLTVGEEDARHLLNAIHEQAIPFFQETGSPEKIADALHKIPAVTSAYELEAIALSCVLLNDQEGAAQAFRRAINALITDGRHWCVEMAERLRSMCDRMESDFKAFYSELPKWRRDNLAALGLTEL